MTYKLVIGSGSREWNSITIIKKVILEVFKEFDTIEGYFHGAATGFDTYSDFALRSIGFTNIKKFPAKWKEYGKAAGPLRNIEMLDTGLIYYAPQDILLIAMPLENSVGTYHMIEYAKEKDVDIRIFDKNGLLTSVV